MKIVAISDLHGNLIDIEECDVLVITGDIIPCEIQRDLFQSWWWFNNIFLKWCDSVPCKKVIFIGGNHDFFLVGEEPFEVGKVQYLFDSGCEYNGIKFWGSPWVTGLPYWAFNTMDDAQYNKFMLMPNDAEILLSHTPPKVRSCGKTDESQMGRSMDFGSEPLRKVLNDKRPRYLFCGHIHSGDHNETEYKSTKIINCSILDEAYSVNYPPAVVNI